MNKEAALDGIRRAAFNDELEKVAVSRITKHLLKTDPNFAKLMRRSSIKGSKNVKDSEYAGRILGEVKNRYHSSFSHSVNLDQMISGRTKLKGVNRPVSIIPHTHGVGTEVRAYNMKRRSIGVLGVDRYGGGRFAADFVDVSTPYRRKGVATAMHMKAVEEGARLNSPASTYTQKGKGLVESLKKKGIVSF